jgi:hypothetical protein
MKSDGNRIKRKRLKEALHFSLWVSGERRRQVESKREKLSPKPNVILQSFKRYENYKV